jgi:hypothetical protein
MRPARLIVSEVPASHRRFSGSDETRQLGGPLIDGPLYLGTMTGVGKAQARSPVARVSQWEAIGVGQSRG